MIVSRDTAVQFVIRRETFKGVLGSARTPYAYGQVPTNHMYDSLWRTFTLTLDP